MSRAERSTGTRPPLEVRVSIGVLSGGGLLFLVLGLVRLVTEGGSDIMVLPTMITMLVLAASVSIYAGRPSLRALGLAGATLAGLLYLLLAMSDGPWWLTVVGLLLAASAFYTLVLLNTGPARRYGGLP
ncbi:hypothetical protein [Actinoalloteichus spitiensis]|uniref:hypothetical protein n=1 Tax=Actinoalloteichus spitiensis TaxID=252394 RepID=UPI00036C0C35|nr:hypothetical protein [Actinoalloteichus spitiensis]